MSILLLVTNIYFNSMCAFIAVMCLVGFLLIRADKKRWNAHKARSEQMMAARQKPQTDDSAPEDGKKDKKQKKKKKDEPYEYQDRISEKAMFAVAVLFGALGELLAMAIYRHKWYKFSFRVYIPILAVLNVVISAVILYMLWAKGDPNMYINP